MAVVCKKNPNLKGCFDIYLKDVTLYYTRVHEPMDKMAEPVPGMGNQSKRQYTTTVFMTDKDREALEDDVMVNKQIFEVGKDKNKKRKIKFPLYKEDAQGNEVEAFKAVEGLHGVQLSQHEFNRAGKPNKLVVVDTEGNPVTENIGNGSKGHVKLFGYKNQEDLMNVLLTMVVVTDLVPYEGGGNGSGTFTDDELGITVKTPEKKSVEEFDKESASDTDDFDDSDY